MLQKYWRLFLAFVLKKRAIYIFNKFKPLVIGVTGSVGKSITKEAIYTILSYDLAVRRNVGNENNEIGLPIAVMGVKKPVGVMEWIWFLGASYFMVRKMD
ncbi:hypothetical protein KJ855_04295, partial [Patescibacteria group bacterium]|nr:hypothetical protein [Patescibacteria group bacterium]